MEWVAGVHLYCSVPGAASGTSSSANVSEARTCIYNVWKLHEPSVNAPVLLLRLQVLLERNSTENLVHVGQSLLWKSPKGDIFRDWVTPSLWLAASNVLLAGLRLNPGPLSSRAQSRWARLKAGRLGSWSTKSSCHRISLAQYQIKDFCKEKLNCCFCFNQ